MPIWPARTSRFAARSDWSSPAACVSLACAMPDHAREMLRALSAAGLGEEERNEPSEEAIAAGGPLGMMMGNMVGEFGEARGLGGFGGAGGAGGGMGGGAGGGGRGGRGFTAAGAATGQVVGGNAAPGFSFNNGADLGNPGTLPAGSGVVQNAHPQDVAAQQATPAAPAAAPPPQSAQARQDAQQLAMIQQQQANINARIAQMSDVNGTRYVVPNQYPSVQQAVRPQPGPVAPLAAAELARLEKAIDAGYKIFQEVRTKYADTPTAEQARGEILVMIGYWRGLTEWERSANLAVRFLGDSPSDSQLPDLRLQVARDRLAWAAKPIGKALTRQELLTEVAARFATARTDLGKIVADFVKQKALQQEAQWDLANSFLTEARAVSAVSPTLARGQFVRAARELRAVAVKYPGHPQIGQIAPLLWNIAQEMETQGYEDESVLVWNELAISDPMNPLAQQAIDKIAQTYRGGLKRPLKAAETYVELNFIRGGSDAATQAAVFQIGASLKNEKRWVEALQVLETFVDSFPRHAQAGQALTMIGQIHQTNQAWEDAIKAYRRVIDEYKGGQWAQEAKWSIAECRINLSQWKEATEAYRDYVANTPAVGNVNMPAVNPISYPGGSQQGQTAKPQQGATTSRPLRQRRRPAS